ncbi:MAG: 2-C-methyl-D-erythritol 2,4-cyclodiphosphate synthase [Lentisphaerae bacterium RIFOXYA12_FULL_48_11]|nr:MAG: 2-C-methyl-D-erythritol 2,4-cyclodiphosphate synthase [Lentisphaerae bacterium RIFOXYA12_FULL_48_11]
MVIRTGIGFDVHRFAMDRKLVLGGVEVRDHNGLEGHSDADVLCHAVMDALLGAIADGDIGRHFPDTDPKWRNADSMEMLKLVVAMVGSKGFRVVNVDSTVIAQSPKIAPFVDRMRANLSVALGVTADRVSVKATTMEKMGALGREEGIAVMSVATVEHT